MTCELKKIQYAHTAQLATQGNHAAILKSFRQLRELPETKKTHYFEGRYENIYIERDKIPALEPVLNAMTALAAEILAIDAAQLACGYWFNCMATGHVTLPHSHDDDDELLSAVYYIEVPKDSGNLILGVGDKQTHVEPQAAMAVFFSPRLVHQVERNKSSDERLSIGLNFGLKKSLKSE